MKNLIMTDWYGKTGYKQPNFFDLEKIFSIAEELRDARKLQVVNDDYDYNTYCTICNKYNVNNHRTCWLCGMIERITYFYPSYESLMKLIHSIFKNDKDLRMMLCVCVKNIDEFKTRKQLKDIFIELLEKFCKYFYTRAAY